MKSIARINGVRAKEKSREFPRSSSFAWLVVSLLLGSACIASGAERTMSPPAENAAAEYHPPTLEGYVAHVDGRMVLQTHPVELAPGCHLLQTPFVYTPPESLSLNRIERSIVTGRRLFAVPMRAGYRYIVEVEPSSSAISPNIVAYELDANDYKTRVFHPITDDRAAGACGESTSEGPQARLPTAAH